MPMTEAAIDTGFLRDVYVSLGEPIDKARPEAAWAVRVYYKPFVDWIWGGCILMALGGLIAMSDRRYRIKARASSARHPPPRRCRRTPRGLPKNRVLWPLVGFDVHVVLLAVGLRLNPRDVPSPLVGKPAPAFALPRLDTPDKEFSPREMLGEVWLLNVWASWCVSCRQEHPVLVELAKRQMVPLVGLNYKEVRGDGAIDSDKVAPGDEKRMVIERAAGWLRQHGDPYTLSVLDVDGRVGIDYGVYGVPETYVIDKAGIIRMKHTGPITPEVFSGRILPLLAELSK
jgi:cytochrome c biogenesis protein CcmG/thiol:disulfide interchange protein DsbE